MADRCLWCYLDGDLSSANGAIRLSASLSLSLRQLKDNALYVLV